MRNTLTNLLGATKGEVLFFHYQGENKPARNRFVRVESVEANYIKATDLEKNEPRNFSAARTSNIEVVASADAVVRPVDEVASELFKVPLTNVDGELVAKILKAADKDVSDAFYFDKADAIVIKKHSEPSLVVETNDKGYVLTFKNNKNEELNLLFDEDLGMELVVNDKNRVVVNRIAQPKILDFISELNRHFA